MLINFLPLDVDSTSNQTFVSFQADEDGLLSKVEQDDVGQHRTQERISSLMRIVWDAALEMVYWMKTNVWTVTMNIQAVQKLNLR